MMAFRGRWEVEYRSRERGTKVVVKYYYPSFITTFVVPIPMQRCVLVKREISREINGGFSVKNRSQAMHQVH